MVNNIKPNYVNPLTMMKKGTQERHLALDSLKTGEKKQKALEAKKQLIQNSLLLMKGSSGNGETSGENIELLEKKLEEITNEIKVNKQEIIKEVPINEKQTEEKIVMDSYFDSYSQEEPKESLGYYRVVNDENRGYKIECDECD
jgi:hypothetical protein